MSSQETREQRRAKLDRDKFGRKNDKKHKPNQYKGKKSDDEYEERRAA